MMMRMWDGVTDPFIGFMVDKTNGKFGKNRPFIVIGQIILCVTSWVAFHVTHKLPQGVRFPFYVVVLMVSTTWATPASVSLPSPLSLV